MNLTEESVFAEALEKQSPQERADFLDRACAGRAGLRQSVESLLSAYNGGAFLEVPAPGLNGTVDVQPPPEKPGTIIGPYKLLQQIGEGGMGVVYMAEQTEPVRRMVALKIIKPGMDSTQVIGRFEAERQALAMMDHPNIAKVLDAGATECGRPYFVMELVKGVPITKFCDDSQLTARERLELFIPVCQAVQHAHTKGIIHRDLKPSNVLVALYDDKPVPKVIDFGIAKATGEKLTERTMFTAFGLFVGTLEYMSPEQAKLNALDIDTRSDVYALGVLLYELLTGTTPLERSRLKEAALDELLRLIREEEPPKPSTRVTQSGEALAICARRHTEPAKLGQVLRGELDWIVMKALEKDRTRRYETANGLARDVERYLKDEAVEACPPSAGYRLRKFARRNKSGLAIAGLVLVFLVVLGIGAGWAVRDHAALQLQQEIREAATEAAVNVCLEEADQLQLQRNIPGALAAAKRAEATLASGAPTPALHQRVQARLADLKMAVLLEDIRWERALSLTVTDYDFVRAHERLLQAFKDLGIDMQILLPEDAAKRIRQTTIVVELAAALDDWSFVESRRKPVDEAWRKRLLATARAADPDPFRSELRTALEQGDKEALKALAKKVQAAESTAPTVMALAMALGTAGFHDDKAHFLREVQRRLPGDYWINYQLGMALPHEKFGTSLPWQKIPELDEALGYFRAALALRPNSAPAHFKIGVLFARKQQVDEAKFYLKEAIRLKPAYAAAWLNLGMLYHHQVQDLDQAIGAYRECVRLDPNDPRGHFKLGFALEKKGSLKDAIAPYRQAVKLDPNYPMGHLRLGALLCDDLRDYDGAIEVFREAVALRPKDWQAYYCLGNALSGKKLWNEAVEAFRKSIGLHENFASAHYNLGEALEKIGQLDEAIAAYRGATRHGENDAEYWTALGNILCDRKKDYEGAIKAFSKVVDLEPKSALGHYNLGNALSGKGQIDDAIAAYLESINLKGDYAPAYINLGGLLWKKEQLDDAIAAFRKAAEVQPDFAKAHGRLGSALLATARLNKGPLDEAIAHLKKSTQLDGNVFAVQFDLAVACLDSGQLADAVAAYREVIRLRPNNALALNQLSWALATAADVNLRSPKAAFEYANRAVQLEKENGGFWNTLGVAHYRNGEWKEAEEALMKSVKLQNGGAAEDFFFLAMTHWQLGNWDEARSWYDKGVQWMDNNRPSDAELKRFRAEAGELLGMKAVDQGKYNPRRAALFGDFAYKKNGESSRR